MNKFTTLKLSKISSSILSISLNRPQAMNAINSVMMVELRDLFLELAVNEEQWRCLILTGEGDKAFCVGADLKERKDLPLDVWRQQHIPFEQAMLAIVECPIPLIAAINGYAYGGGMELTLAADFAYAAEHATFAQPETKVGLMPGAMGTQNLTKACGLRRAKELCFTANAISAAEALQIGIINKIFPAADLIAQTQKIAEKISENSPLANRLTKQALNRSWYLDPTTGFQFELNAYHRLLDSPDRVEGIRAFNEKRKPEFKS